MFASPIKKSVMPFRIESTQKLTKNEYNQLYNAPHNIPLQDSPTPKKNKSFAPISLNLFEAPFKGKRRSTPMMDPDFMKSKGSSRPSLKNHNNAGEESIESESKGKESNFPKRFYRNLRSGGKENDYPGEKEEDSIDVDWVLNDDELDEEPIEQPQPKIACHLPKAPSNKLRKNSSYLENFIKPPKNNARRTSFASSKSSINFKNSSKKGLLDVDRLSRDLRNSREQTILSQGSSSILDNFIVQKRSAKRHKKPSSRAILSSKRGPELISEFMHKGSDCQSEHGYRENQFNETPIVKKIKKPQVGKLKKFNRKNEDSDNGKNIFRNFLLGIEVQRLNKMLGDMDIELEKKDVKMEKLKEKLREHKEKAPGIQKTLEILKMELKSLAERNRQINLKNKNLQIKNEQLRTENKGSSIRRAFENNVTDLQDELVGASNEIESLKVKNEDLQNQLEIRENEVVTLKQILNDYQDYDISFKRKSSAYRGSGRGPKINNSKNVILFLNFLSDLYITMAAVFRLCEKTEEKNLAKKLFDNLNELKDDESKLRNEISDSSKRKFRKDHNVINDTLKEIKKTIASKYHRGRRDSAYGINGEITQERNEFKTKYEILTKKFNDLKKDYELLKRREPSTIKRVNPISNALTPNRVTKEKVKSPFVIGRRNLMDTFNDDKEHQPVRNFSRETYLRVPGSSSTTPNKNIQPKTTIYRLSQEDILKPSATNSPQKIRTQSYLPSFSPLREVSPPKKQQPSFTGTNNIPFPSYNITNNHFGAKNQARSSPSLVKPLNNPLNPNYYAFNNKVNPILDPKSENSFQANSLNESFKNQIYSKPAYNQQQQPRNFNMPQNNDVYNNAYKEINQYSSNGYQSNGNQWGVFQDMEDSPLKGEELIGNFLITATADDNEQIVSMKLSSIAN